MSEHEILQRIFCMMRTAVLMCRNGKNNAPRPIKNTSKQMCYNVLAEIQDLLGTNRYYLVPPKMTNADKIRTLSDEELAGFIQGFVDCAYCTRIAQGCSVNDESCFNTWLDWLKQEAE